MNFTNSESLENIKKIINNFKQELKTPGDFEALNIAYEEKDLKEIQEIADFLNKNFKQILIMGIGGSSLGAKTLLGLKQQNKVIILENIDDNSVNNIFESLDLEKTAFLTISKSGKTIECISQTLIILKKFEDKFGKGKIKNSFFFLTENKDSPLTQLAKEFGIKTFDHHKTIGGRFSYLSNVALIPASIIGLNIKEIRKGAQDAINYFINEDNNFIANVIINQNELFKKGIVANILMTYCERFTALTDWYRQLWAESIGKNGFGILPIPALGTVDQHSQLQLYMDGPRNLFFTFILNKEKNNNLAITKTYHKDFDYLKNMSLNDIMNIEANSTIEVLNKRNLPIRIFEIEQIDERMLSQLMMQYILETIIVAKLNNINPFGQPSVEERKILAHEMFRK